MQGFSSITIKLMFIFLSKLLPLFVYPLGLSTILILFALIFSKHQKISKTLIILSGLILFLSGNRWVSYSLARSLEWKYLPQQAPISAPAIVVLGGGTESSYPPRTAVEVNSAGDRMIHAADLYHAGAAPLIVLSGGNIDWMDSVDKSPAADMQQIMIKLGVPESAILLQPKSQNTHEDAVYCAELLKARGINRIILVTTAMHMPRSVPLFEKQGLIVIPSPADFTITEDGWQRTFSPNFETLLTNILPNSSSLGLTTTVLKEYLGLVSYHFQGWL
ncbi:YdcF family protein [Leptolinea tardivitalis]|nr:YdcF family protein [Leptolinea tardivitalis]GAP21026.1 uncharacterized conserved protein [Leptolinea tardivitalis]